MDFDKAFFDTSDYELGKELGHGKFGTVYLVENNDNEQFAAKVINVGDEFTGKEQMLLMREFAILLGLKHPAIVKFKGINFHSFEETMALRPTLLTEYLPNGSFKDILNKQKTGNADSDWNPTKKYVCMLGIADAMRYLHKKGILHRDLKPENILLDENYYPRICDFGLSRCFAKTLTKSMKLSMSGKMGTPLYMAPEFFTDEDHFGPGIDVYAFALIAYEIVSDIEPYTEKGQQPSYGALCKKITDGIKPKFVDGITEPMKDLLGRCWSQDPKDRPSFDEIFEELSSSFNYIYEDVDEKEIKDYLADLEDFWNEEKSKFDDQQQQSQQIQEEKEEEVKKEVKKEEVLKDESLQKVDQNYFLEIIQNQKKVCLEIVKDLVDKQGNVEDTHLDSVQGNILHLACKSGDIDLVKYLISLDKIDINTKTIFFIIF
ncbi:hypothetical protein M9Y10_025265 [Tritrichomonas musculus]|uniref:Protein kinase domain-containing protein n=1 Tax=Tritrichomonas musculus TaxID=1915356 RepID=A0ABR2HA14_9EUKA